MGSKDTLGAYDIDLLKEKYKDFKLIYVRILGQDFVFRTITFDEYEHMARVCFDQYELHETACQITMVYPDSYNFSKGLAGIPDQIGLKIIEASGFAANGAQIVTESYRAYRSLMDTSKYSAMATIKAAMPDVSIDEMEGWPWDKILKYLAISEKTLNILGIDLDMIKEESQQEATENEPQIESPIHYHMMGVDPILMYGRQLKSPPFVEFPLIGGRHWRRGDVLNEIRRQMDQGSRKRA